MQCVSAQNYHRHSCHDKELITTEAVRGGVNVENETKLWKEKQAGDSTHNNSEPKQSSNYSLIKSFIGYIPVKHNLN